MIQRIRMSARSLQLTRRNVRPARTYDVDVGQEHVTSCVEGVGFIIVACQVTTTQGTTMKRPIRSNPSGSTLYPQHPPGSQVIFRVSPDDLTNLDRVLVAVSSVVIVGSVAWIPLVSIWAYRKWKCISKEKRRKRAVYAGIILSAVFIAAFGPHRSPKFGKILNVRRWRLWKSWIRFIAMEVIVDQRNSKNFDYQHENAIFTFIPHGVFPFSIAFGVLPELAREAFGKLRPVVATAVHLFPIVRDIVSWVQPIDASRDRVDAALSHGERIAIVPGGIAEIFEGYPKQSTHPDEEYAIVRKGILKMAIKHGIPVVPVYCFGATKMLHRLELPILERLSLLLRMSICIFYGLWGLPIPFRQKLSYVMGDAIRPPSSLDQINNPLHNQVDQMHSELCNELVRLFDRHKSAYGWSHKTLKLLTR